LQERLYDDAAFAEAVSSERARIAVVYRSVSFIVSFGGSQV
jgi:hypothetical protein